MGIENDIPGFDKIKWFIPKPKGKDAFITIPNDKNINFNSVLCKQISTLITIGIHPERNVLYIKEKPEIGYRVPKSGSIKAPDLIEAIKKRGMKFPVRYHVQKEDTYWIATFEP